MNGFAVRNDGTPGWRAIAGDDELNPNEFFSEVEPAPIVPLPPSEEDLSVQAKETRDKLLAVAANRMGPLQDAVDTNTATAAERQNLVAWKQYRIALNRIEQQGGFPQSIVWPVSPEENATL